MVRAEVGRAKLKEGGSEKGVVSGFDGLVVMVVDVAGGWGTGETS